MSLKFFYLLMLSFLSSLPVLSQGKPYYFKHYEVEHGLSNNTVLCSVQDKMGFIWFGTIDGLNRFDGYSFKIFQNDPGNPRSLGNNSVFSLYASENEKLWVGTGEGLFKYDPVEQSFELIPSTAEKRIGSLCEDTKGNIWFLIQGALAYYDQTLNICRRVNLKEYHLTSICIDQGGNLWVATSRGLIGKYNPADSSFNPVDLFKSSKNYSNYILEIFDTKKGFLLVGTSDDGVKLVDIATYDYQDILVNDRDNSNIYAKTFIQYSDDEYWIATENGIFIYDMKKRQFTSLRREYNNIYSISDNAINSLLRDKEGGVWVGTRFGGINYYPHPYTLFKKYFSQINKYSITGNGVHEICPDPYGNLWIGTEDAGLNKMNVRTGNVEHFIADGKEGSISYSNIHGLLIVDNELWIGTYQHGLDRLNLNTGKVIKHYTGGKNSFKGNFIVHLFKSRTGDIYVGTWEGLYKYNRGTDNFSPVPGFAFQTQNILEDDNDVLWICTLGNGVYTLDQRTGVIQNFRKDAKNANTLCNNMVNGQFKDSLKNMWFATQRGLSKYDPIKKIFTTYTVNNGLPSNFLFKILEDDQNNLWISSTKGLIYFNPLNEEIKVYTTANGLLNDQFNWNSAYKGPNGEMYFGSVKGMISFSPKQFSTNNITSPVYITGITVDGKELAIDKNSPLKKSISYTDKIILKHNQSTLSIDFTALSFTSPETNEYAYKMEGFDKEWVYLKTYRNAYFTQMPPGNYIFKVKASNSSGLWNNKETVLQIEILPPPWATTWAYLSYLLIGTGVITVIVWNYHKWISEKNKRKIEHIEHEKEKELYKNKVDFFTNIAHEIRTPLTLIQGPLENLMRYVDKVPGIKGSLKIMDRNTHRLLDIVNQLLDFRQTEMKNFSLTLEYINVSGLLADLHASFEPLAAQHRLRFSLQMSVTDFYAFADADSLQKILSNLYTNAIKYAAQNVEVTFQVFQTANKYCIEIKNDGFLIPYESREKIFEPFFRIKETSANKGTGIGLAISRTLAELHKARLMLKKPENGMNVFGLELNIRPETEVLEPKKKTL